MLKLDPPPEDQNGICPQTLSDAPTLTIPNSPVISGMAQLARKLQDSESRYQVLFEAMDEGFCIIEQVQCKRTGLLDFFYLEANPAFMRQSGISHVVGKTMRQVIPDECEEWIATYAGVVETGRAVRFERGLVSQGRVLELHAFPFGDVTLSRLAVSFHDVTERKRSEDLLLRNRDTFFNLVENAPFGLYVVDAQFCLLQVSMAARKVFSQVVPLIGRNFDEVLRCVWAEPFASEALARFRHTLATGETYSAPNTTQARNDIPVIESYDWKIQRITLPDGQFGVACYFYDITERMLAQETLRQSEERFRALFDRGPVGICSVDAAGVVQEYNAVAAQFWGREPLRGDVNERFCGAYKIYRADGTALPHALTPVGKVLAGEVPEARNVEAIMERPDGSRITVLAHVVPLHDAQGGITGAINCFFDITERKRLERETQQQAAALEEQDRRKNEFLAMLSHELRNPLAPIMNAVHLLSLQGNEAPPHRKAREIIDRQVRQLKLLVDDLLEVSRITSGRVQLQCSTVSLRGVVERAVETLLPVTAQRGHEVIVALPVQEVWLHADAARLEQVVVNLLTNASKYSDIGGQIWINAHLDGDSVVLSVRDMGIGISPNFLPHVFDLFLQAERSLDRSQGGLGVGLCLVKRLTELHGGTVCAQSVLGQGSEFTLRLPLLSLPPSLPVPPAPTMDEAATAPASIRRRILVVDDNADAADSLRDLLELAGHEVQVASDGHQALATAKRFCPEVFLLDIGLPGLTGLEVAKRLRLQSAFSKAMLIAMTGYGHQLDRAQTLAAGFDHHLVKPTDFDCVQKILTSMDRSL